MPTPTVPAAVVLKLVLCSVLMAAVPLGTYHLVVHHGGAATLAALVGVDAPSVDDVLVWGGGAAVLAAQVVVALYVALALDEGDPVPLPAAQEGKREHAE